ncbi:MAG: PEP-CTERM sorting domain-containing protein [Phycisphaerae bacterium]|nr:PEP-CTERM sorting domain-containing protein [Phycisphaerae bacterium]
MKKALCLVAMLALVATASADVRVFATPASAGYGLDNAANAFQPTFSTVTPGGDNINAYDFYYGHFTVTNYPPLGTLPGTVATPIEIPAGDFAYIWLRFESEPKGVTINGLKVLVREVGTTEPAAIDAAWYVQNDKGNTTPGMSRKRWDGTCTPPGYAEFHMNPQAFVAVTANGITNLATGVDAQMMSTWLAGTTTQPRSSEALIGAIQGTPGKTYEILIPSFQDINYTNGTSPAGLQGGVFKFLPEPTSLMLLGLAGLVLRRR